MSAANTDYWTEVGNPGTATTLAAPGHTSGGTSLTVVSTTNWPTTTGVIFAMDTVSIISGVEVRDVGSYREYEGVVASSTSITNVTPRYGSDRDFAAGSTTRVYIPVASSRENRMAQGLQIEHDQDGTHGAITTTSISNAGATTLTGALTIKSYDGYITSPDTWTYASATTFTIAGVDRTAQFPTGTKLKLTQTTVKYFYVVSASFSTNTTVTISGGSDYSLANAAITIPTYSYDTTPQAFPQYFAYTPTTANITTTNATFVGRFSMVGKKVSAVVQMTAGTSSALGTDPSFTTPTTAGTTGLTVGKFKNIVGRGDYYDASGPNSYVLGVHLITSTTVGFVLQNTGTTFGTTQGMDASSPVAMATGDIFEGRFEYESA